MKRIILSLAVFLFAAAAWGQVGIPPGVITGNPTPGGACAAGAGQIVTSTGTIYTCLSGVWTALGTTSFPGVTTDGANGLTVTGAVAAGTAVQVAGGTAITGNQGNGLKVQHSTGTTTTDDCGKFDSHGNIVDAGAACGSGSLGPLVFNAQSYGVKGDTQLTVVAHTTSGSPTVTCATCAFVAGDVGKIVWVMTTGSSGVLALSQTTISAVNSATSITASINATSTVTAGLIVWGSDDTTALANTWNAAKAACASVVLPSGRFIVQAAEFNVGNAACLTLSNIGLFNQPGLTGQGKMNTELIPSPTFDFSTCAAGDMGSCFYGANFSLYRGVAIFGANYNPAGGANAILSGLNGGFFNDMDMNGWCATCAGSIGVKMVNYSSGAYYGGTSSFGATNIYAGGVDEQLYNFVAYAGSAVGLQVHDPNLISTGNAWFGSSAAVIVDAGYVFNSFSDMIMAGSANLLISGSANIYAMTYQAGAAPTNPVTVGSTGILSPSNTAFPAVGGSWGTIQGGGAVRDFSGGNLFSGTTQGTAATPVFVQENHNGSLTNVTSAAVTLTSHTTIGSLIIVGVEWGVTAGQTSTGCTDTEANTYTQQGSTIFTTSTYGTVRGFSLYYTNGAATNASDTITCTWSASVPYEQVAPYEITGQFSNGAQATSPFDVIYTNTGAGTAVAAGTTTTTTHDNDMIGLNLQFNVAEASWTNTGVAQTLRSNVVSEFYVLSTGTMPLAGTYTLTGTLPTNTDWAGYWFAILPSTTVGASAVYGSSSIALGNITSANWSLPAGSTAGKWGTSPSLTLCSGGSTNQQCQILVGSGTVGANPIVTITFPVVFLTPPICSAIQSYGSSTIVPFILSVQPTKTSVAFQYVGTPAAGATIQLVVRCSN